MANPSPVAPWALALARARVWALLASVALSVGAGILASQLKFNFSPENLFVSGDETLQFYLNRQVPAFGAGDTVCAIAVQGDLRKPSVQKALHTLHHRLKAVPGVLGLTSPLDARLPMDGILGFEPVFESDGSATLDKLKKAAQDPMLGGLLISKDLQVTSISARLDPRWGNEKNRRKTVSAVREVVADTQTQFPEIKLLLAGIPVSQVIIVDTLQADQMRFIPLVVLIMGLLLWFSFRDLRGVILPFLATGAATLWTLGYLVLIDHAINVVNNAIVVLLLVIGVADAVHLVSRFFDELALARENAGEGGSVDHELVVAHTIQAMALPCFLTTSTTAIGFASALVADVALLQEFGVDAAVGVLLAFISTLLIVPAFLGLLPLPPPRPARERRMQDMLHVALGRAARFSIRRRKMVLLFFSLLLLLAGRLAVEVSANQRIISELPAHDPSIIATRFFEKHLAGIFAVDVVFDAEDPKRLTEPDVVRAMDALARFAESQELGPRVLSYPAILRGFDRAMRGDDAIEPVSEWSDEKILQLQLLFDLASAEDKRVALDGLISADGTLARVRGLARDAGNDVVFPFIDAMRAELKKYPLPGVQVRVSGGMIIASQALGNIVTDMASSLGAALVAILVFMTLLFRSLRVSLVALLPNAVPILAALATMVIVGIELRVATALIFSMALGVAVDACVHLLARMREEQRVAMETSDPNVDPLEEALVRTIQGAGRPVVYATVLLLVGFCVMAFSEFNALRHFAVLGGATLAAALLVDILVLPALAYVARTR